MARRVLTGAAIALLAVVGSLAIQGVASAASQIQLVLSQGAAFSILGYDCGGIQEQTFATGFDPSTGYPTGDAFLKTICSAGGKGGHSVTITKWGSAEWDFTGALISDAALSGAPSVNPALTAFDFHGNEVENLSNNAYLVLAPGYVPVPRLLGISATYGPASGGTTVSITGTGFTGATSVDFGGVAVLAPGFTLNSDTSITVASPPSGAGTVDVTVTTAGGTDVTSPVDQFTFYAQPTVSGLEPNSGPYNGGTAVTIAGTGFTAPPALTTVMFGDVQAAFVVDSPTAITAFSPNEGNPDNASVTVTTPGGTSTVTPADQFTFTASSGCGTGCLSTVQCAKLSGSFTGTMKISGCTPASPADRKASMASSSDTWTWSKSGLTTVVSMNPPVSAGQDGCPTGRTEYDLSGAVVGGTSTYANLGDAVGARVCVNRSGRLSLVRGTTFAL